jgi:hypothetical protein
MGVMVLLSSWERPFVRRCWLIAAACLAVAACTSAPPIAAQPGPDGATITPLHIEARGLALNPRDPNTVKIGRLSYLAGYELQSDDKRFGGLSGLQISPDGSELIGLSDRGYWVSMSLVYEGNKLAGIGAASLGVLGNGFPGELTKRDADAESLAIDQDGSYLVGFEENQRVWRYPSIPGRGAESLSGRPMNVSMPPLQDPSIDNEGLESLTVLRDGQIFAALESPRPGETRNRAWVVGKDGHAEDLLYDAKDRYSPTDFSTLPGGDVIVLERYFAPLFDVRARIRIIKRADIVPGALLEGELIAELRAPLTVDNMEGIASRRASDGPTLVYVISDDNYNAFQRTLLLEFQLDE